MSEERKINMEDAAIFRIQALQEQTLRLTCEIYAHLAKQDVAPILARVLKEVSASTKELISMHSHLRDSPEEN
jgi:hypothetical protein